MQNCDAPRADAVSQIGIIRKEPKIRRTLLGLITLVALMTLIFTPFLTAANAETAEYANWNAIVDDMQNELEQAVSAYQNNDPDQAKQRVNDAYYGYYEKLGFEKTVMAYISGDRATKVEYQFTTALKAIANQADPAVLETTLNDLITMLRQDADQLDGKQENALSVFLKSLLIILREGFEAIIVLAAVIAYLVKSGKKNQLKVVYAGGLAAVVASVIMAYVLNLLAGTATGSQQEIVEGVTILIAVAVLFYASNWMLSKSESLAWRNYIETKAQSASAKGSVWALAGAAFLVVFREGAETILFYQALVAGTNTYVNMLWLGLAVGVVGLVAVFILIRYFSIKLPIKPFFFGTSILLFVMCISFVGSGIKELQEGRLVSATTINGLSSIDLLGIYPTWETVIPQLVLLAITVATLIYRVNKWRLNKTTAETTTKESA